MMSSQDGNAGPIVRARKAAIVIDGDAVVVARVAKVKSAVERAASAPTIFESDAPDLVQAPSSSFGRRAAPSPRMRRRPSEPDLFFQARSLERFAAPARAGGLSLFLRDKAGSIPAGGKIAGLGLLVLCLLIPAVLLVSSDTPVAASVAGKTESGFVVTEVSAAIRPRGDGEVLEVEGVVRNVSGKAGAVPPLRIALADDAGATSLRPLPTFGRPLAPGASLRFHSAVAVPVGTEGDVSVDFVPRTEMAAADGASFSKTSGKTSAE